MKLLPHPVRGTASSRLSLKSDSSTSSEEKSLGTTSWTLASELSQTSRSVPENRDGQTKFDTSQLEIVPLASAWSGSKPLPRIGTKGICLNYNII